MTDNTPTIPEDLIPLDNASLRDPLMIEVKDTRRDVTALHPLLDLLETPDTPETDLIEQLVSALREAAEELRLSRAARIDDQKDLETMRCQMAEMHALLFSTPPEP